MSQLMTRQKIANQRADRERSYESFVLVDYCPVTSLGFSEARHFGPIAIGAQSSDGKGARKGYLGATISFWNE